jgi:hypothetical protein
LPFALLLSCTDDIHIAPDGGSAPDIPVTLDAGRSGGGGAPDAASPDAQADEPKQLDPGTAVVDAALPESTQQAFAALSARAQTAAALDAAGARAAYPVQFSAAPDFDPNSAQSRA